MKARFLVVALALLMASSISVASADPTVPFKAHYHMSPWNTPGENGCINQTMPGVGQGTHLGESTWFSNAVTCPGGPEGTMVQHGSSIFTADNGDQLIGTFDGFATMTATSADCWGDYTVTAGTGHFAGVTGHGKYSCHIVRVNPNYGVAEFEGVLTK